MTVATRASHSSLHEHPRLVRGTRRPRDGYFLRAESFFNVASMVDQLSEDDARLLNAYVSARR